MKSKPTTDSTPSTPGDRPDDALDLLRPRLAVRLTEAPSGRRIAAKKAPWSSSGRKLCGVIWNSPPAPARRRDTTRRR